MGRITKLSAMQAAVLDIPLEFNIALLGGRGGGKTTAAMLLALQHVKTYGDAANVLIVRKTYKALTDFEDEFCALLNEASAGSYSYNKSEKIARVGGAKIELGAVDSPRSYERMQGGNRTLLILEEVTQHAGERVIRLLRSNLRAPEGVHTRVIYVGNPGGPLHGLVYKRHVQDRRPYQPYDIPLEGDGDAVETWVTVPSTITDNAFVDQAAYIRRLREACHGDPARLNQWLYGAWTTATGLMFPNWTAPVALPADFRVNPDIWRFRTAIDWGGSAPSVALLGCIARRPVEIIPGVPAPRGSVLVAGEVTDAIFDNPEDLSKSHEWSPGRLGERVVGRCASLGVPRPSGVIDNARGLRGETLIEEVQPEGFWNLTRPRKGRRAEGYTNINSMLTAAAERDPARPHLYISDRCRYLLATLPNAVRDEQDPDDVLDSPSCPDHALDSARYLLALARETVSTTTGAGSHVGLY